MSMAHASYGGDDLGTHGVEPVAIGRGREIASDILALFSSVEERIECAGSLRRMRSFVGDLDFVVMPRFEERPTALFEEIKAPVNLHLDLIERLIAAGTLVDASPKCRGERTQRVSYQGMKVEFHCVLPPMQWGWMLALRTGPEAFTRKLVLPKSRGGFLPDGFRFEGGQLWADGEYVPLPEESDLFEALGMPWIPPEAREAASSL